MIKALVLTNMYPSSRYPAWGTFIADQVKSLQSSVSVTVVQQTRKSSIGIFLFLIKSMWSCLTYNYDIIHAHYGFHSAIIPLLLKRSPIVVSFHGSDALIEPKRNRIYDFLQRWVVKHATCIVAVGEHLKTHLINEMGANRERIIVIPCGVDTDQFILRDKMAVRKKLNLNDKSKIVLFIGRQTQAKGVDLLRNAASQFPEVQFYFIGEYGIRWTAANCTFVGVIPHSIIHDWINAADILVLPSLSEGTPVTVLESLASETPVVCTNVGSCPSLVSEGVTGLLIPPQNISALTEAIHAGLYTTQFRMKEGRTLVLNGYSLNESAKKLISVYERALKGVIQ